ncbi:hypothetical protein [Turicimonas muris]|uniref:hypothetical protein n=1 Tax=Turicimonas muris TaxID=1796652 RepID=UPI0026770590|nr:hypothetical protein [Turicimonas muris]MBS4768381.1 hypothetical protein [Burkholderiales bacterium]
MQTEEIKVTENGKTITTLTLEDCEKYHGLKRCGGLALCFRMLKMALDELVPEGEVARRNLITFKTAFAGPGITDSAEMIGRCVTRKRFLVLPDEFVDAPECIFGKLYFEIGYGSKVMKITAKEGVITPEFLKAGRKFYTGTANKEEAEVWIGFKGKLYDAVLNSEMKDIVKTEIVNI